MSVRLLAAAFAIICAPLAARSADDENPFKNAKVGDYATYKMSVKFAGTSLGGTSTQSVTAKTDKEATVKTTGVFEFMGNKQEIPARKQKIDLTKPFDPTKVRRRPASGHRRQGREGEGRQGEDQGRRQGVRLHLDDLQGQPARPPARPSPPTSRRGCPRTCRWGW